MVLLASQVCTLKGECTGYLYNPRIDGLIAPFYKSILSAHFLRRTLNLALALNIVN